MDYASNLTNNNSDQAAPPVAPSRLLWTAENNNYSTEHSEQQALNHLLEGVHQSRLEDLHTGQYKSEIHIEEMRIVPDGIEIRARITPVSDVRLENSSERHQYPPQYPNKPSYQPEYQIPYQSSYQYSYPPQYQVPYQLPYQAPYPNQYVRSPYVYPVNPYASQLPAQYFYRYPVTNVASSIANAISQLALTTNLLRR